MINRPKSPFSIINNLEQFTKSDVKGKPPGLTIFINNNNTLSNNTLSNNTLSNNLPNNLLNIISEGIFYIKNTIVSDKITNLYNELKENINNKTYNEDLIKILEIINNNGLFSQNKNSNNPNIIKIKYNYINTHFHKFYKYTFRINNKIYKIYFYDSRTKNILDKIIPGILIQEYSFNEMNKELNSNFNNSKITIKVPEITKYCILSKKDVPFFNKSFFNDIFQNSIINIDKIFIYEMDLIEDAFPLSRIYNKYINKSLCQKIVNLIKFIDNKLKEIHLVHNDLNIDNIFISLENILNKNIVLYIIDFELSVITYRFNNNNWTSNYKKYTCIDNKNNNTKSKLI